MANQSSAYDLSLFEPKQKEQVQPGVQLRELPAGKKKAKLKVHPVALTMTAMAVIAMVAVHIANNAALTESKARLEYEQAQLNKTKSADELLDVELERLLSIQNLDEYAKDTLGLCKPESYQVAYLPGEGNGTIEVCNQKTDSLWDKISACFKQLVARFS